MQVLKCGWCKKEGHFVKNIKNRFLKLSPEKLSYYTDEAGKLKGEITIYDETKFISMETPGGLPMFLIEGKNGGYIESHYFKIFVNLHKDIKIKINKIENLFNP